MESKHTPVMGDDDREQARALSLRGVRPPLRVPGYEQEAFLGHGAYGEVWVAVDSNSGRKVAIKFYTRRGGLDWAALAREVEKLRYLFNDRYVVQLLRVGWEAEPPYYVMEYMDHGSLEDLLAHGTLSVHDAAGLFREVAVALVHAHNKGILHCDLKPANILLDHDRHPRLADFGQSRLTNEMAPALGTLFYMAPEQADLSAVPDARWDVYALGAVMYRMLAGAPPHRGEAAASAVVSAGKLDEQLSAYRKLIQSAPRPAAHRKVPGVDADLAAIVDRCLEPIPSRRYPNPQAVLSAIDAWSLKRVRRPLMILTGIGFAALLLVMGLIGTVLFRDTVLTAQDGVIDRTLEGNRFAARAEAQQMSLETEHRWRVLEFEADDPHLQKWLATGPALKDSPDEVQKLEQWLGEQKEKYDRDFHAGARSSVWVALDRGGYMRGMSPQFPQYRHRYFGYRDYFTGLGRNVEETVQPPPAVIPGPHRSVVYRRRSTQTWAVTFSVPVKSADGGTVGVLGMSVDLKQEPLPPEELKRFSVLIDTRPDGNGKRGLVVRHPYMADLPEEMEDENLPLYHAREIVERADAKPEGWRRIEAYHDPVEREPFTGEWLASAEPVVVQSPDGREVDTGFIVVVQERRDDVLQPVRDLQWRLGYWASGAVLFVLVLVLTMLAGIMYLLDASSRSPVTRVLRKWAGLPTAGTGVSGTTGTSGTPTPGSVLAVGADPVNQDGLPRP